MTESYPLRWPDGWPKTRPGARKRGEQFRQGSFSTPGGKQLVTFSRARRMLLEELARLGAQRIVISTSIDVRPDGVPARGRNADVFTLPEPGAAVYFMLKNRPMVMAQDAYDNPAANLRSLGLAIDAMRSLERHGGGTMMERAFDGFAALPPPAGSKPRRPWWEILRYSANPDDWAVLSGAEIEARYRKLAQTVHPDKPGGSSDAMAELNQAKDDALAALG